MSQPQYPTWPVNVRPAKLGFSLKANTAVYVSPFTGDMETQAFPGARWTASLTIDKLLRGEIAELEAFLWGLGGMAGRFWLWHHAREKPRGSVSGTILVDQNGLDPKTLYAKGFAESAPGVFLAGDMVGVNGELKVVTSVVNSVAGGFAQVPVYPPFRTLPKDNDPVVYQSASCLFRLKDDGQGNVVSERSLNGTVIEVEEAFA